MLTYLVIGGVASVFYYIGNHEYYEKGWILAIVSILFSFAAWYFLPFVWFGMIGANVLLYLILLILNMISKRPPGSRSGL